MIDNYSVNQVILVGRLGHDPETKELKGFPFASFSLATNRGHYEGENWVEETDWHQISCWNATANFSGKLKKGQLVSVIGSLHYSIFEDKEKRTHKNVEIVAEKVVLLEGKKEVK